MSVTYEPLPIEPPDLELLIAAHLRSVNTRPGTLIGRQFPSAMKDPLTGKPLALPFALSGTTYTAAVVIRDDGGPWPNRTLSAIVLGARDADYSATRALAVWVASRLSALAVQDGLPIAAVTTVRGPLSVVDNPPEFHTTADLLVVG
ncbi:MAG TPA: hypothetical protein PKD84_13570 [Propionicimonas sp.]|nr:hypothetical protein [Propionicimonas sp.]